MTVLRDVVRKVRSKNAGPFWVTLDVFCGSDQAFATASATLQATKIARIFGANTQDVKRFDLPALQVIKISLPRPSIQGSRADRDMHGAGWAALLAEMPVVDSP